MAETHDGTCENGDRAMEPRRRERWTHPQFPQVGHDSLYPNGRGAVTSALTLGAAALTAVGLALAGALPPVGHNGDTQTSTVHAQFLKDLKKYRPSSERVLDTGISKPGIPVSLGMAQQYDQTTANRVSFRCHGHGTAKATTHQTDGAEHSYPVTACGQTITSITAGRADTVIISADDDEALIVWAVVHSTAG
ncbi:hypothetical protein ACFYPC_34405 [Streptomyces sp. NPDC005808]|uniref:hypothetical protein n=1 Tax=Streptomyces sp. NPDC005808 TaxID=3364734 RepID=UPI0036A94F83